MAEGPIATVLGKCMDVLGRDGTWTQKELARAADGHVVAPWDPDAVKWCANGLIQKFSNWPEWDKVATFVRDVLGQNLWRWNDAPGRTQAEVCELFALAAGRAKRFGI